MEGETHQRRRYGLPMDVCLHVESRKRLEKGYVQSCVYDCSWTMTDGEIMIEGKSEIYENGRGEKLSWSRKEMPIGESVER